MMNDKELLELAAKAAGLQLVWGDKFKLGDDEIDCTDIPYIRSGQPDEGDVFWNPLDDDGDALRLAVQLHINIEIWNVDTLIGANIYLMGRGHGYFQERYTTDPYAATRRAIVRAAAEIGKEKK